jgi:hypothetical protein
MPLPETATQRESMLESFPWDYFASHSESTGDAVVRWIYSHFAGRAYQGFVQEGRGLLVGPFLTGGDKNVITSAELIQRRHASATVGMTIVYVTVDHPSFENTIPDARLREQLRAAAERYDPDLECLILLLASNVPHLARIVGAFPNAPEASPRASYESARKASRKLN